MNDSAAIANVSDTSFWVAYYRQRETERPNGLFKDPFAKKLVGERGRRIAQSMPEFAKYTEWSVVARTVIIDRFIEKAISEGVDAVINLGAGLDARPYRMKLPRELLWIEVDYSNIMSHKESVLAADLPVCRLERVAVDLANAEKRAEFLIKVAPQAKKILVLTEGVIPYLTEQQVSELSADLLKQKKIYFWITEYLHPKVYKHLQGALRTAQMKNAAFLFYPSDWFGFFKKIGWVEKETRYSGEIAKEFKRLPPMPVIAKLFMFLMPEKMKQQSMRMTGYIVFQRDR